MIGGAVSCPAGFDSFRNGWEGNVTPAADSVRTVAMGDLVPAFNRADRT